MATTTEDEILATYNAALAAADEVFRAIQHTASEQRRARSATDYDGAIAEYNAVMAPAREAREAAITAARVAAGWEDPA